MTEKKVEIKSFMVHLVCDKCGVGEMKRTDGVVLSMTEPGYPHECSNCSEFLYVYGKKYPYIIHEPVNE